MMSRSGFERIDAVLGSDVASWTPGAVIYDYEDESDEDEMTELTHHLYNDLQDVVTGGVIEYEGGCTC